MVTLGVGIMYFMLGIFNLKFLAFFKLPKSELTTKLGKTFLWLSFIIITSSLLTMFLSLSIIVPNLVLLACVAVLGYVTITSTKKFNEDMKYSYHFFLSCAMSENKEDFELGYKKRPNAINNDLNDELFFKMLSDKGILEEWVSDKKEHFSENVFKLYQKYRIRSIYNKDKLIEKPDQF